MILFDTDLLSLYFWGHPRVVRRYHEAEDEIRITVVSRIEVLQGRFEAIRKAENGERLLKAVSKLAESEAGLALFEIVPFDQSAAAEFDRLLTVKKLKKIGRGDLLIASIALANRATLVTRNVRHFELIPSLQIENWAD
jgi:tRNA(fMet)-specific endonuclease VapC